MGKHKIALRILREALFEADQTVGYHDGQVAVWQSRIDSELGELGREPDEKTVRNRDMHARERDGWAEHREALWESIAVLEADQERGV